MKLPSPQFARLITALALDLNDPSLESMTRAWEHIAKRYFTRLRSHKAVAENAETVRLLAIHDAVLSALNTEGTLIFTEAHSTRSRRAALAAVAKVSHDILSSIFQSPADLRDLRDTLEESLSLINSTPKKHTGISLGARSAAAYIHTFASTLLEAKNAAEGKTSPPVHRPGGLPHHTFPHSYKTTHISTPDYTRDPWRHANLPSQPSPYRF